MRKLALLFIVGWLVSTVAWAQSAGALVDRANNFFKVKNYAEAAKYYAQALESLEGDNAVIVKYQLAASYFNLPNYDTQFQAIPLLQQVVDSGLPNLPQDTWLMLASLHHKQGKLDQAKQYLATVEDRVAASDDKGDKALMKRIADQLATATTLMASPLEVTPKSFGPAINTEYTEYNPVLAADNSLMAYTVVRPAAGRSDQFEEKVMVVIKTTLGKWSEPKEVPVGQRGNVGTAGISADGTRLLVFIQEANNGDLFWLDRQGQQWTDPQPLTVVNTPKYTESTASMSPDGKRVFFASNRPGGLGGTDIWMRQKESNGEWGPMINLGPNVNSPADEDGPFIHPDGRTLFFTSSGRNTMGGKDIFKAVFAAGLWRPAVNVGYPINSTYDDAYFTLSADGQTGFYSSDRPGGKGGQDLYEVRMPEGAGNIPLTMLKGQVLGADNKAVPTTLRVFDVEAGNKLEYAYNPDPVTGNYMVILPPGKKYEMIIEAEGFLPYSVSINVPDQDYFYELYQQIVLKPVTQFDEVVGQSVSVTNAFFDTEEAQLARDAMLIRNDSVDVYQLLEDIIASNDQEGLDYLLDIMYTASPMEQLDFSQLAEGQKEAAVEAFFYDEYNRDNLERREIDGEVVYSLPTLDVTEKAEEQRQMAESQAAYDPAVLQNVYKVFFGVGSADVQAAYHDELNQVADLLQKYPDLSLQVSGYASADGDVEANAKLSNERAIAVLTYLNDKGIKRRRIVARGYGATQAEQGSAEESRRVEVRLVDLNRQ